MLTRTVDNTLDTEENTDAYWWNYSHAFPSNWFHHTNIIFIIKMKFGTMNAWIVKVPPSSYFYKVEGRRSLFRLHVFAKKVMIGHSQHGSKFYSLSNISCFLAVLLARNELCLHIGIQYFWQNVCCLCVDLHNAR